MEAEVWFEMPDGTIGTDRYWGRRVTIQILNNSCGVVRGDEVHDKDGPVMDVLYSRAVRMIRRPARDDR